MRSTLICHTMPYYANATPPQMFSSTYHTHFTRLCQQEPRPNPTHWHPQSRSFSPHLHIVVNILYLRTHAPMLFNSVLLSKSHPHVQASIPKTPSQMHARSKNPSKKPPKAEKFKDPTDPGPFPSPCLSFLHSCTAQAKESKEGQKEEVLLNQCCVRPPLLGIVCMYS